MNLLPERIKAKIVVDQSTGCWLWQGYIYPNGYGYTHVRVERGKFKAAYVHRFVYEILVGPIENQLDHVRERGCIHKHCCNPAHLEDVTSRENHRRADTRTGVNARKTHCNRGHEFTPDNTRITPRGTRDCLKCGVIRQRIVRDKRKAARRG